MVKFLIKEGADPHLMDDNDLKPITLAFSEDVKTLLREAMDSRAHRFSMLTDVAVSVITSQRPPEQLVTGTSPLCIC